MHRIVLPAAWIAATASLLTACGEDAEPSVQRQVDAATAALVWPDGGWDVNCTQLVADGGAPSDDDCAKLDRLPGGLELADELYRRLMWNMFAELARTSAQWRAQALIVDDAFEDAAGRPVECETLPSSTLAAFQVPPWLTSPDWIAAAADPAHSPPHPDDQPVWDQHGNPVQVEVAIVYQTGFRSVEAGGSAREQNTDGHSGLDTVRGQIEDMCAGDLMVRSTNWGSPPSLHLKLAWRTIQDERECEAYGFITHSGAACAAGELGLVAMHITAKVFSQGDFWLWGTFSHRNTVSDGATDAGVSLPPLFRDPTCAPADCPANTCPPWINGRRKTQVVRLTPIPPEVSATKELGVRLGRITGALARYDLLGVQRVPGARDSTLELPPPRPESLANEILEWDRQEGSCIGCHARARVASLPGVNIEQLAQCRPCDAADGRPGACLDETASGPCQDCRAALRTSRYHQERDQAYAVSDLTWIYDHFWPPTGDIQ